MLAIQKIDHIGIRVREKARAIAFYEILGFELIVDVGFEQDRDIAFLRHAPFDLLHHQRQRLVVVLAFNQRQALDRAPTAVGDHQRVFANDHLEVL